MASSVQQILSAFGITPEGGGGGDPIAFVGTEYASSFPDDTQPCTTSSFTPNAGSRLLVITAILGAGDEGDWSDDITISDTQSLTWTPLVNDFITGASYGGGLGYRIWISSPVAASAMTVTVNSPSSQWRTSVAVGEFTGSGTTISGLVQDDTAPLSGGYTATLSEAPTANDASVFLRLGNSDISGAYTMTGWTTLCDLTTPTESILFVAVRTGSTSSSAVLSGTRVFGSHGIDAVFNLKAA